MDIFKFTKPLRPVVAWSCIGVVGMAVIGLALNSLEVTSSKMARLIEQNEFLQTAAVQSRVSAGKNGQPALGEQAPQLESDFLVVKYADGARSSAIAAEERAAVERTEGLEPVLTLENSEAVVYKVPKTSTADEVAQRLEYGKTDAIEYAEVDPLSELVSATANDPYFLNGSMWGLYGDASQPTNPFGSQAAEAWSGGYVGDTKVVVGVIDTGVDYTHPDLYLNIFLNQGEIPTSLRSGLVDSNADGLITFHDLNNPANAAFVADKNGNKYIDGGDLLNDSRWENGTDEDGNGYVDDLVGWDFNYVDNEPSDINGHGTHVAGTVAAVGGNSTGVAGVGWHTTILPLKHASDEGPGFFSRAARAMDYMIALSKSAPNQRYRFVATNNSYGSDDYSYTLQGAIERSALANIVTVAAAGNRQRDTDVVPYYPQSISTIAAVGYEGVISVGANNNTGERAWFSNYGTRSVDLLAPGQDIVSTTRGGGYGGLTGTSMATPHVAGALGVYVAHQPGATGLEMRSALLNAVQKNNAVRDSAVTGGLLSVADMLPLATTTVRDTTSPSVPANLRVVTAGFETISLEWDAAVDDTEVASYRVFRDGAKIADVVERFYRDEQLVPKTKYQYSIQAVDTSGNVSGSSVALSAVTTAIPMTIESFAVIQKSAGSATLGVNLTRPGTVRVHYGTDRSNLSMVARATSSSLNHQVFISGMKPGALYYYRIVAIDADDSSNTARTARPSNFIVPAAQPFTIVSHGVSLAHATSARVSVTLSAAGNVRVHYGTSTRTLDQVSYVPARLATDGMVHTVPLNPLLPGTTYYYRVVAINLNNREEVVRTGVTSFATPAP